MHEFNRLPQLATSNTMISVKLRWHPCGSFTVPLLISSASERSYIHRKLYSQVSVIAGECRALLDFTKPRMSAEV